MNYEDKLYVALMSHPGDERLIAPCKTYFKYNYLSCFDCAMIDEVLGAENKLNNILVWSK